MTATPFACSPPHEREEFVHVLLGQRTGGFVEHQHPAADRHGAGDLHELLLGQRQVARHGFRREVLVADLVERPAGHGAHLPAVEQQAAGPGRLAAQEDVFHDAQVRGEREILVNGADAPGASGERGSAGR